MQIHCIHCKDILKVSEKQIGKKGTCPTCFQIVEISKKNEHFETPYEFSLRLQKKGFSALEIQKKMILTGLEQDKVEPILKNLKQSLSIEEQKNFGEVISWTPQQSDQNKKTNPLSLQPRNFTFSLKNLLLIGIYLCILSFIVANNKWCFKFYVRVFTSKLAIPLITVISVIIIFLRYFLSLQAFSPKKNYNLALLLTSSYFFIYLFLYFCGLYAERSLFFGFFTSLFVGFVKSFGSLSSILLFCIFFVIHTLALMYSFRCSHLTPFETFCICGVIFLNTFPPLLIFPSLYLFIFFRGFSL